MTKFEVGKQYYMTSPGDHNCQWNYRVIARTAKTVTLEQQNRDGTTGTPIKRKIKPGNCESVMPLGSYSMAPCLRAEREVKLEPEPQAPSNVVDFTARLRERQQQDAINQDIERFKREYLPYMDESDRNLLSSAPDEGKSLILGLICMRIDVQRSRG